MSTLVGKSQIVATGINITTGQLSPVNRTISSSFGSFVCNGVTPVTVTDTSVSANSVVMMTLKTIGGTVSVIPLTIATITVGTGFTVVGQALDTSTYNYRIFG